MKYRNRDGTSKRRRYSYEQKQFLAKVASGGLRDSSRPGCQGKKVYRSYDQAMRAARVMFASDGGEGGAMCVYRCEACKHFHCGHQYLLRRVFGLGITE